MTRIELIEQYVKSELKQKQIELVPVSGDASFRKYYRVIIGNDSYIVMDSPTDKEPPEQFIEVTKHLVSIDVHVPQIFYENKQDGVLIIKDFGDTNYLDILNAENADLLYREAIDALIEMQEKSTKANLPEYDRPLLLREMALFEDWLINEMLGIKLTSMEQGKLSSLKELLVINALGQKQVFVHRDYHSRNLMYLKMSNPGIIDYQDAVIGPISYDLVSLLKDCYIKWPLEKIEAWCEYYFEKSTFTKGQRFDEFMKEFHLMGVQRHLKASGIFARLKYRDGKANYIKDIPRTLSYITDLVHLESLKPLVELIDSKIMPNITRN